MLPDFELDAALVDLRDTRGPFSGEIVAQDYRVAFAHAHDPGEVIGLVAFDGDCSAGVEFVLDEQARCTLGRPCGCCGHIFP